MNLTDFVTMGVKWPLVSAFEISLALLSFADLAYAFCNMKIIKYY